MYLYLWKNANNLRVFLNLGFVCRGFGVAIIMYHHCCPVKVPDDYYKV